MNFITGKHLPRRTFLRGMGAHGRAAVPGRDGAGRPRGGATRPPPSATRLICIEEVHGAAGCNNWGATQVPLGAGDTVGRDFELVADNALTSLEAYRDYLTIVSNTDVRMAEAFEPPEIGGDHFRSSAVFLTQSHPKQTQGSDLYVGTSLDQIYAKRFGQDTPIPSMQLCIENLDQAGGCTYNYACAYTDTISWASPTEPLPMIRDPRVAFDMLFGAGGDRRDRAARSRRHAQHPRLDRRARSAAEAGARRGRPHAARPVSREHPRARAPHPGDRSAQHAAARSASCPRRRPACPTRSPST